MGRKYIGQVDNHNFVYPNYEMAEYDVEIVHDINNNCITGTVTNFIVSTYSSSGITFSYDGTYNFNGSEPFKGALSSPVISANYLSVHCQAPSNTYMNTWRVVDTRSLNYTPPTLPTTGSWTGDTFTITPAMFGLGSFTYGIFYFEFRFIAEKCIYKICTSLDVSPPTPTPTPNPICSEQLTISNTDDYYIANATYNRVYVSNGFPTMYGYVNQTGNVWVAGSTPTGNNYPFWTYYDGYDYFTLYATINAEGVFNYWEVEREFTPIWSGGTYNVNSSDIDYHYIEVSGVRYPVPGTQDLFDAYISYPAVCPTNTPTPTPGLSPSLTPTNTLTPTISATATRTPTPTPSAGGSKSLQIYGRDVSGSRATITLFYSLNGGSNINVPGYTGDILPSTCSLLYTITGLTTGDNVTIGTSTSCVMTGNGSSSSCPSSGGSFVDYTYAMDAPTTQQVAITINTSIIP